MFLCGGYILSYSISYSKSEFAADQRPFGIQEEQKEKAKRRDETRREERREADQFTTPTCYYSD